MTMRLRWRAATVFSSWSMRGRSDTKRNKSRNSNAPSRPSAFRWRKTSKIMTRLSPPSSLRSLEPLSAPRNRSRKSKNYWGRSRYSRKSSVCPLILNHHIELRNISNISDKVTEVGEKLIQFRIMKAEEPDLQTKFNAFQDEIVQIGSIDFETDVSQQFGKYLPSLIKCRSKNQRNQRKAPRGKHESLCIEEEGRERAAG